MKGAGEAMGKKLKVTTTIRLDFDLVEQLKAEAEKQQRSISNLVSLAVVSYLNIVQGNKIETQSQATQ
jgi:predicted transcriptional regulator